MSWRGCLLLSTNSVAGYHSLQRDRGKHKFHPPVDIERFRCSSLVFSPTVGMPTRQQPGDIEQTDSNIFSGSLRWLNCGQTSVYGPLIIVDLL